MRARGARRRLGAALASSRARRGADDGQAGRRRHGERGCSSRETNDTKVGRAPSLVALYCGGKPSTRNCADLVVPSRITSTSFELADAFHAIAFSMLSKAITTNLLGAVPSS